MDHTGAIPVLVAICEGSDPSALGYLVPLGGAALVAGILVLAFLGTPGELRPRLAAVLAASIMVGGVIVTTPGGFNDPGGDYIARSVVAVVVCALGGALVAVNHRRYVFQFAVVGGLGGVALIGAALGLLVAALWGGGACLG